MQHPGQEDPGVRREAPPGRIRGFERYLTLWVLSCIVAGIFLG